jgi:hypothetical protein
MRAESMMAVCLYIPRKDLLVMSIAVDYSSMSTPMSTPEQAMAQEASH